MSRDWIIVLCGATAEVVSQPEETEDNTERLLCLLVRESLQ